MSNIHLIALPVDGSPACRYAFELSKLFLKLNKALQIIPIHIWGDWQPYTHNILFPFAPLGSDIIEFERELEVAAKECITQWLGLTGEESFVADSEVYRGSCRHDLPKAVTRAHYDLIAVGAYGESGTIPHYVGSVTHRLVQTSSTPIIVAKPTPSPARLEHITVAIDMTNRSHLLLQRAIQLATELQAELDLIYVFPDPVAHEKNDLLAQALNHNDDLISETKSKINAYFSALVRKVDLGFLYKGMAEKTVENAKILFGDPVDTIINYCIDVKTDLLYIGKRDPSRNDGSPVGRVAQQLLYNAPCHIYLDCSFRDQL